MRWLAVVACAGCGFHRGGAAGDAVEVADGLTDTPADDGPADANADAGGMPDAPAPALALRQINSASTSTNVATMTAAFPMAQLAGDLNIVVVGWYPSGSVATVTDTSNNMYTLAVGPTTQGMEHQAVYYKCGIASAAANTVTVTFSAPLQPDVHVIEYSGVRASGCLDRTIAGTGNGTAMDSGALATSFAHDLLVAATFQTNQVSAPDPAYTSRGTNGFGDLVEDRVVMQTGSYHALATQNASGDWVIQLAAFKGF